jgi:hypothetical protein
MIDRHHLSRDYETALWGRIALGQFQDRSQTRKIGCRDGGNDAGLTPAIEGVNTDDNRRPDAVLLGATGRAEIHPVDITATRPVVVALVCHAPMLLGRPGLEASLERERRPLLSFRGQRFELGV